MKTFTENPYWVAGAPGILKNDVSWHKNEAVKQWTISESPKSLFQSESWYEIFVLVISLLKVLLRRNFPFIFSNFFPQKCKI